MPRSRVSKWQYLLSPQSIPAWCCIVLGIMLILTPYLVERHGFKGSIMVAREDMPSPFDKTLILIGQHTVDGAVGIVLNKPLTESQHGKLSAFMRDSGIPVGYGGPIETSDKLFVLQILEPKGPGQNPDYDLSRWDDAVRETPDLLDKIKESLKKGERRYRVFTGYAGWGPFQLEAEIAVKFAWHNIPMNHDVLFQSSEAAQWESLSRKHMEKVHSLDSNRT